MESMASLLNGVPSIAFAAFLIHGCAWACFAVIRFFGFLFRHLSMKSRHSDDTPLHTLKDAVEVAARGRPA